MYLLLRGWVHGGRHVSPAVVLGHQALDVLFLSLGGHLLLCHNHAVVVSVLPSSRDHAALMLQMDWLGSLRL